jgi:hypothetical protein
MPACIIVEDSGAGNCKSQLLGFYPARRVCDAAQTQNG